ncbi:polyprenol monophosphomannose synthase [Candidatus Woesearchaeota archaeon]|nr:polyprenol monophosphomannose synthase [Candidatus Woesearchaeota archaeon]
MKICIVIPTYNERENIRQIVEGIREYVSKDKAKILFVDDNSPDGTAKEAAKYGKEGVYILKRDKKEGLGKAYTAGFTYALKKFNPEIVFEMDADCSHPTDKIPLMIKELGRNDLVIGSRYVDGGGIIGWNRKRRFVSRVGNSLARLCCGLSQKDCTSGFRAMKAEALKKIGLKELSLKGYAFQIELLKRAKESGARIKEIPIVFNDRKKGKSKLGAKDFKEFLFYCIKNVSS